MVKRISNFIFPNISPKYFKLLFIREDRYSENYSQSLPFRSKSKRDKYFLREIKNTCVSSCNAYFNQCVHFASIQAIG